MVKRVYTMEVEELVVVAEYNSNVEAEMAKSILACAGIDATIESEIMSVLYPYIVKARIVVASEDHEQARMLLRIRD